MPMYKKSLVALLFIAVAVIGGTIYGSSTNEEVAQSSEVVRNEEQTTDEDDTGVVEGKTIFVYVTGGVNKPGMVELVEDKTLRVADAIETCGGLLPTADVDNINLAETISDGQHIRIPEKIVEQTVHNQSNNGSTAQSNVNVANIESGKNSNSGGIVNINTATSEELQTLNGIGSKMAERIIEYRQNNGAFKNIEDIQNVRGIGEKTFEKLKSRIKVQ